jgi:rhodanese-related sulfurtransferase
MSYPAMKRITPAPFVALAVLLAFTCPAPFVRAGDKPVHKDVNADEFERLAKNPDVIVLDVRSPKEYEAGHLKNAVLINLNSKDFDEQIKKLDKTKTYAVYCAVGGRSAKACDKLDAQTFPKVFNLTGGIKAWEKAGKPTEK